MRQVRVHGAAGTSPSRILQTDPVHRDGRLPVTARALGGPNGTQVFEANNPIPEGYDRLAAFRWGNLTSGTPFKAITAFFIPQLTVNAAGWMMPSRSGFHRTFSHAAVRVAALSATGFIAVGLLWFFYVVPSTGCEVLAIDSEGPVARFKTAFKIDTDLRCRLFTDGLSQWVGAALALTFAAALPAFQLARPASPLTIDLDDKPPPDLDDESPMTADTNGSGDSRAMSVDWAGDMAVLEHSTATEWLRRLHLAFVVAVVGLGVAISNHPGRVAEAGVWIGLTALIAITATTAVVEPVARASRRSPVGHRMAAAVVLVTPLAVVLLLLAPGFHATNPTGLIPAHFFLVNAVVAIGAIALIMLLIQSFIIGGDDGQAHFAATSVAALSMLTAGVVAAGLGYLAVVLFDVSPLRDIYGGNVPVAMAFSITLAVSACALVAILIREARRITKSRPEPETAHLDERDSLATGQDRRRYVLFLAATSLARNRLRQMLCGLGLIQLLGWLGAWWVMTWIQADVGQAMADPPLAYFLIVGALSVAVLASLMALGLQLGVARLPMAGITCVGATLVALFVWRLTAEPLSTLEQVAFFVPLGGLILTIVHGFTDSASRRGIGIVSDLAGFWPRTFHPLTPRPYSGIAVRRLEEFLRQSPGPMVIAAHSQGTVLSTLALSHMSREHTDRIALITYGSPLGGLYPTVFPAQFVTDEWIKSVNRKLDERWINLGRHTDPIAQPIAALEQDAVSDSADDGEAVPSAKAMGNRFFPDAPTRPSLHSDYEREMPFRDSEQTLANILRPTSTGGKRNVAVSAE